MTESQATTKLVKKLNGYGFFWKASDRYRAGIPDIIGIIVGRFIAIEMKIDYGKPTALQMHSLAEIHDHGGIALVVKYVNQTKHWRVNNLEFHTLKDIVDYIIDEV